MVTLTITLNPLCVCLLRERERVTYASSSSVVVVVKLWTSVAFEPPHPILSIDCERFNTQTATDRQRGYTERGRERLYVCVCVCETIERERDRKRVKWRSSALFFSIFILALSFLF
jgi:hypothetical protein